MMPFLFALLVAQQQPAVKPPMLLITLSRLGDHITLRYPIGVSGWKEVCVYTEGAHPPRFGNHAGDPETLESWAHLSCWKPRFVVEDYMFPEKGALKVWAELWVGSLTDPIRTPRITLRPIESPFAPPGPGEGQ